MRLLKFVGIATLASAVALLSGCGEDKAVAGNNTDNQDTTTHLRVGISPGPFGRMIEQAIAPTLKEQGYTVEIVEFTDYVQPNLALESGDLNANLMQHTAYLNNLVATQGIKIEAVTTVPTLGMGVFSAKVAALPGADGYDDKQAKALEGGTVGLPNDAVNLARALRLCSNLGLITVKEGIVDENKISTADIAENPHNLNFVPMEAAQLSRSLDSLTLAFIPGNYAYAASLDYSKALGVEQVAENIKNVVAVRQGDQKLHDLFFQAVRSPKFKELLEADKVFDNFTRPQWWSELDNAQPSVNNADSQKTDASLDSNAQASSDQTQANDQA